MKNLSGAVSAISYTTKLRNLLLSRSLSLFHSSPLSTRAAAAASPKLHSVPESELEPDLLEAELGPQVVPDSGPTTSLKPTSFGQGDRASWPRPAEIRYQPQAANKVHLIGSVSAPVQLDTDPEGRYWAVSALSQQKTVDFPSLWIPIKFEGDLAQTAACHLKENDIIYITGQISGELSPFNTENRQASIQVLVHEVSYVNVNKRKNAKHVESLWKELIDHPNQWWDCRIDKENGRVTPRFPDFKHKVTGSALWLDSAPVWILSDLREVEFDVMPSHPKQENGESVQVNSGEKKTICKLSNESDLQNKSHREDNSESVQENSGAKKSMSELSKESYLQKKSHREDKEALWKDLLENPHNWWDNRPDKTNPKYPDFKHKVTREALWIIDKSTPAWVIPDLPPAKPEQDLKS